MKNSFYRTLSAFVFFTAALSQAQFQRFTAGSISVGGTGQFTEVLTANPTTAPYPFLVQGQAVQFSNQRQDTTLSAGFVGKVQFQPLKYAGLELNYGFSHYSELYSYTTTAFPSTAPQAGNLRVKTYTHEATGAFLIHPKHIPFQPYLGIGGGAIDFNTADNQWRGAGLLETGFDLPMKNGKTGFRIGARSLYYRAPNFDSSLISTRSWRVTAEPEISSYYKF